METMSAEDMIRLSASEVACYRWPEDTAEHRAMRAAFIDGAAYGVTKTPGDLPTELTRVNRLCDAAARNIGDLETALQEIADCLGNDKNEGKSPAVRESNTHSALKIAVAALSRS